MSAVGANYPTLSDIAKMMDPDGKPAKMIEILAQSNVILDDMPFYEGNLPTGHQVSVDVALPSGSIRKLNTGTVPTKGQAAQFVEQAAIYDIWSQVDVKLAEKMGNVGEFRMQNARKFIEGLNQTMVLTTLYGNPATTEGEFSGLLTRCNAISGATNANNVIDGGGSGSDNTSLLLVGYGPNAVHGMFPRGSQAGMQHHDLGIQLIQNAAGTTGANMLAYVDEWIWDMGLVVEDWRFLVRICNIDVSNMRAQASAANLTDLMMQAQECLPYTAGIRPVFYMPRMLRTHLRRQRRSDVQTGGQLHYEVVDGKRIDYFDGIKIEVLDRFSLAETRVT